MFSAEVNEAINRAAKANGVEPAVLKAVVQVESGGRLFATIDGKPEPIIRFEGHYFHRLLSGEERAEAVLQRLASPIAGEIRNPRSQSARWRQLRRAMQIDRWAALQSVSWGCGQVMGSHWKWLGYASVDALVADARQGADGQIALMMRYIKKAGLVPALQARDWAQFARVYNGPAYARLKYDVRLHAAYQRHQASKGHSAPGDSAFPLRFGSRGREVRNLQKLLGKAGYDIHADGIFGLVTDRIVRHYQRDHRLPATGIVAVAQYNTLREALALGEGKVPDAVRQVSRKIKGVGQTMRRVLNAVLSKWPRFA